MQFLPFVVAPFIALYGLLALLAGPQQWRLGKIPTTAANSLMLAGALLLAASVLVWLRSPWALWLLGAGLVAMHVLAAINRKAASGSPAAFEWKGQGGRLLLSALLFGLSYIGLQ